jgi:hypothetical protein
MSQDQLPNSGVYACEYSMEAGEQLFGTATRVDAWVLIEYTGAWGHEALDESDIPDAVKAHLAEWLAETPNSKVKLIRQTPRRKGEGLACFVARSDEASPRLHRFQLDSYEALLDLDLAAVLADDPAYQENLSGERLVLVCTNGRRDTCCARYGMAAYRALSSGGRRNVWQSSHLGGHRFAATAVCLPHGLLHGRIGEGHYGSFVETYLSNQVLLETYRGRTCYDKAAQAADYFLREETGERGIGAFRLIETIELADGETIVRFSEPAAGRTHLVKVGLAAEPVEVYKSSGDEKTVPIGQYRLLAYEVG